MDDGHHLQNRPANMADTKIERTIASLRKQANEYAEIGREFPLTGAGNLFEFLDDLDAAASAGAKPKARIGSKKGGIGRGRIG